LGVAKKFGASDFRKARARRARRIAERAVLSLGASAAELQVALINLDISFKQNIFNTPKQTTTMYGAQQLAYAPTPYSYTPSSSLAATINLDQEVKLADSATERELYESLAEIYSIIITLDALEKAYLRDSIHESEYTETCDRLLRQYKSNLADETVADAFGDLERFKAEWHLEVPKATERLRIGIPATVETAPASQQRPNSQQPTNNAAATHIVSASESFITLLDAIKLNMLSKETLHPILVDTIQAVNKVTDRDFENKAKIIQWLITLNQMRVAEELSSEQARELQFDMQLAYDGFKGVLQS
jgi:ESCRT-I complex subunit VPS28